MEIGLIGEGVTDQKTIEHILIGYFEDKDLFVKPLQPKPMESGNWDKVFKYCKSEEFRQALPHNDMLVVQIDIDFFRVGEVPENLKIDIKDLNVEEIVEAVKLKLIESIGKGFYDDNSKAIVFAIAVDQIECWFLPIYFQSQPKKAAKISNCIDTLNTVLIKNEKFYIDKKNEDYYVIISKNFHKKKNLIKYSAKNPSFKLFIEELDMKTKFQSDILSTS